MCGFLHGLGAGLDTCRVGGPRVLLAVSGGADSVAMLRGCIELRDQYRLELHAAHLNHGLRAEASKADADWLAGLCRQWNVPCSLETRDVREFGRQRGLGIEEAARQARYLFLEETARRQGCPSVAVAHTADDQAETILHHIVRGTGMAGLRGMRSVRALSDDLFLTRPMLDIGRRQVEEYLTQIGQDYRHDKSNSDETLTRNRIRRQLLPLLERDFNPRVRETLRRLGRQAAEIDAMLETLTASVLQAAVAEKTKQVSRLRCDVLMKHPRHLIRECLKRLWRELDWPEQRMGFDEWERLADLVCGDGTAILPGNIEARRRGTLLVLRRRVVIR